MKTSIIIRNQPREFVPYFDCTVGKIVFETFSMRRNKEKIEFMRVIFLAENIHDTNEKCRKAWNLSTMFQRPKIIIDRFDCCENLLITFI